MPNSDKYSRFFKWSEFDSPDDPGSGKLMNPGFIAQLNQAREICEEKFAGTAPTSFNITSGYRTKEHNKAVGGSDTSSHLLGVAADISFSSEEHMLAILASLFLAGFRRVGVDTEGYFIHVDADWNKDSPALWGYND